MNMNVSSWAIRNPVPVILLFVLMTVAGLMAFPVMKVQSFPDIDIPTVTVTASLPGASPSQMETEVARRIENSLATLQGVKHIKSSLTEGEASITVEFRLDKPTQEAVDGVRDAVSRVRSELPASLRDPVIKKAEVADGPMLTYTVASTRMDDEALSWFVDNQIARTLLAVPGVGAVTRVGGVSREVRVDLDPDRLLALHTSAADISRQLGQVQQDASGGRVRFVPVDGGGIQRALLKAGEVFIRPRQGGERLQTHPARPRRSLRNLLQEASVPAWERNYLPYLWSGERLAWVAGLGVDVKFACSTGEAGVLPVWEPD